MRNKGWVLVSTWQRSIKQTSHWEHHNWKTTFPWKNYDGALKWFGHKRKAPVRTKHCIELVVQKNTLQAQISATIDPQERASLQDLLNPIKEKIWSYRSLEKHFKKRWLCKESQTLFHKNPSKARKDLSQPKTSISLSTDKSKLDAYKSDCVKDDKDNIYLSSAKELPD